MSRLAAGDRSTVTPSRQSSMLERAGNYIGDYAGGVKQALQAPATTTNPQTFAEHIGNVPVLGPLYGAAEAALSVGSGMLSPLAAFADPNNPDAAAQRAIYEPRSAPGKAALGMIGAVAKPAIDAAEATGSDVALLPLATEAQALRTVSRAPKVTPERAPSSDELATAARGAYQRAKDAGAVAAPEGYARMASGLRASLREQGFNPKLHPKAAAVVEEIEKTSSGAPVALDEIEILRRQALAAERSIEADERRVAGLVIDRLDDYADALASGAEPVMGGNAPAAVAARKEARDLYSRNRKSMEMQELIERAQIRASQFSGSGEENALRTEFRQLAMNPKRLRRFNREEQQAIKEVAFGTPTSNALRQLGKLAPTGGLSQWLSIGATMLNPLAAAVPAAGAAGRLGATLMTRNAARRAEELMRRGPQRSAQAAEEAAVEQPAITGELMPRQMLALPAPNMIAGQRSAPGSAFAREQVGLTPDVERAGAMHPGAAREIAPRRPAALPLLPAREPASIVVDSAGRAGAAADVAAYQDELGLSRRRGVRQPKAEPNPEQNLFAQLAREQEATRAGRDFDAERAAAAQAARDSYVVDEAPRSAVREITLETLPEQNRIASLAPSSVSAIEKEMREIKRRALALPNDSPELLELDARYSTLLEELEAAKARPRRNRLESLAGRQ